MSNEVLTVTDEPIENQWMRKDNILGFDRFCMVKVNSGGFARTELQAWRGKCFITVASLLDHEFERSYSPEFLFEKIKMLVSEAQKHEMTEQNQPCRKEEI